MYDAGFTHLPHGRYQEEITLLQASVALNSIDWQPDAYPMDFYSADSLGPWTPNFPESKVSHLKIRDDEEGGAESSKSDCNDCRCGGR